MKITPSGHPLAIPIRPARRRRRGKRFAKQVLCASIPTMGLTGWGEAFAYGAPLAGVQRHRRGRWGRSRRRGSARIEGAPRSSAARAHGVGVAGWPLFALSGIDLALWDSRRASRSASPCGSPRWARADAGARVREPAALRDALGRRCARGGHRGGRGFTARSSFTKNGRRVVAVAREAVGDESS
jgi:hypothetical protein